MKKPPSQRPERRPHGDDWNLYGPEWVHRQLHDMIQEHADQLAECWSHHQHDGDIVIIAHLSISGFNNFYADHLARTQGISIEMAKEGIRRYLARNLDPWKPILLLKDGVDAFVGDDKVMRKIFDQARIPEWMKNRGVFPVMIFYPQGSCFVACSYKPDELTVENIILSPIDPSAN